MNYNAPNYRLPGETTPGQPSPTDVFGGADSVGQPSVGTPLLSGTYGEVDAPLAPAPVPGGGRAIWLMAIVGALTLLVGGGFLALQAFSAEGGADTPEEAVDRLIDAMNNEDVITFVELLEPSERRTVVDPMLDGVLPEMIRLGVFSDDFDANQIDGIDLQLTDVTYRIEPVAGHADLVHAYFTSGTVSSSVTADELPLGEAIRSRFGDQMQDSSEPTEAIDGTDGMPLTLVERNGKWYVSMWFSLAEIARIEAGEELPLPSAQPPALGSPSPEAAVRAMVDELVDLDLEGMIGRSDPDEMAALYRYSPLFLDDARNELRSAREAARDAGASWDVTEMGFEVDTDGDDAIVTIRSFTASVETPEVSVRVTYSPELITAIVSGTFEGERIEGRLEVAPRRWSISGTFGTETLDATVVVDGDADRITLDGQLSGEPFDAVLSLDASGACSRYSLDGFDQSESGCLEDFGALGMGSGAELLSFVDNVGDELPGLPVATHKTDGAWYVSPMGTAMYSVVEGMNGLEQQSFDDFMDQMVMSTEGPGMLGALGAVPFGLAGGVDPMLQDPTTTFGDINPLADDPDFNGSVFDAPTPFVDDSEIVIAAPGPLPTTFVESLESGERHVWIFQVDQGQSVGVTLFGADRFDGGIGDPYLEVQKPDGLWFTQNDDNEGLSSGLQFTADISGEWRVLASDLNSFSGSYELTLEVVDPGAVPTIGASLATVFDSEFGADIEDVVVLDVVTGSSGSEFGQIGPGGYDLFELALTAGDRVVVNAQAVDDSGLDSRLVFQDPAENVVAENDDAPAEAGLGFFDSQIDFTASESGVHLIELHSFGDLGEGSYILTVTRS